MHERASRFVGVRRRRGTRMVLPKGLQRGQIGHNARSPIAARARVSHAKEAQGGLQVAVGWRWELTKTGSNPRLRTVASAEDPQWPSDSRGMVVPQSQAGFPENPGSSGSSRKSRVIRAATVRTGASLACARPHRDACSPVVTIARSVARLHASGTQGAKGAPRMSRGEDGPATAGLEHGTALGLQRGTMTAGPRIEAAIDAEPSKAETACRASRFMTTRRVAEEPNVSDSPECLSPVQGWLSRRMQRRRARSPRGMG
jgi:hypothetical protein